MEPVDYLRMVRRRWMIAAACVLLAVVAVFATTPEDPGPPIRTYRAEHTLLLKGDSSQLSNLSPVQTPSLATIALLTTRGEVPERVAAALGYEGDPAVLAAQVETLTDDKVGSLAISATNPDGDRAAEITNAFAAELTAFLTREAQDLIDTATEETSARLEELEATIKDYDAQIAAAGDSTDADLLRSERDARVRQYGLASERYAQLAQQATADSGLVTLQKGTPVPVLQGGFRPPSSRQGRLLSAVGVALVLAFGVMLVAEMLDRRLRNKAAAERAFRLPVVAEIPTLRGRRRRNRFDVVAFSKPTSRAAESFRALRTSLLRTRSRVVSFALPGTVAADGGNASIVPIEQPPRVVLVTSAGAKEGKSTTVANLAAVFAETGRSVLVVSADFRRPEIHKYLGVPAGPGLAELIQYGSEPDGYEGIARPTQIPGVRVIAVGRARVSPSQLIGECRRLLQASRTMADVVLVDTAPILAANDALDLAPEVDAVLLVARSGKTTATAAERAGELLSRLDAPVLGVALTGATAGGSKSAYHHYYFRRRDTRPPRRTRSTTSSSSVSPNGHDSEHDVEQPAEHG